MAWGLISCDFASPTVLLELLLCPWTWGISSKLLQRHTAATPVPTWIHSSCSGVLGGPWEFPDNIHWIIKKQESSRKTSISALLTMPKPLPVWITINWKILKEMGIPDHLTCLLRNLYAGQEATVRTRHGTAGCQIGKRVCQG